MDKFEVLTKFCGLGQVSKTLYKNWVDSLEQLYSHLWNWGWNAHIARNHVKMVCFVFIIEQLHLYLRVSQEANVVLLLVFYTTDQITPW